MSAGFVTPNTPNVGDFTTFLQTSVQIPTAALPTNSPWIGYAFDQAMGLVPCYAGVPGITYSLAVYNCGTHLLFLIAPDQTGQTYFVSARRSAASPAFPDGGFGLNAVSTGLVVSSSDEGTSATLTAPKWADGLTIEQLGMMKSPWGRAYLDYLQKYGSTIWGLT
jgi:hypothetical protein